MRHEFLESINKNQAIFGVKLSGEIIERLADYYELIQKHNEILHLVAPSPAEEFATRHILESLTLLEYLPKNARFADIGTGAGLPSIPCLIVRPDLHAILIESKPKKVKFLEEAAAALNLGERAKIVNKQFEETPKANIFFVTCRALDKFTEKLPKILKWSGKADLLFFGGENLREALEKEKIRFSTKLMPLSEQRFLFTANFRNQTNPLDKKSMKRIFRTK
ncbi:MAG: 16S rRNA (guanine(527)-N(7))-methyltransferase RsmG [Pyrinomonadaceae bacterium]|nr:16S rRNA (guanine(527)-N(7))-methyltransferase RsmG [Pyrinomonadaceae bacterium]